MKRRFRGLGMPQDQELRTKRRIRGRDGNRCVVCQMDENTHEKRYGRIFDVHRGVQGSEYSTQPGICFTLCEVCHDALERKRHWGWISKYHPVSKEWVAASVQESSRVDLQEEESWRRREAWGAWVKKHREAKFRSLAMLAIRSDLSEKKLRDIEAGRQEPYLFEAKKLSTALGISLDELATEKEPVDGWRALCEEQSHRRALIFRVCEPQEGEIETLSREARLVWELIGKLEVAFKAAGPPPAKRPRH